MSEDDRPFLGDRYELQVPIARGDVSIIYRGRDIHMKRDVAIKVLRKVYSSSSEILTRFQHQAKVTSDLHHSSIVQVYDYGQIDGKYYMIMELVEGTDLHRYFRSRRILTVNQAVIIAHGVALGLGVAHLGGTVHGSINTRHVLIGHDGQVKLTAFLGTTWTPIYQAPEQLEGEMVTSASDVYSLGVVMYEILTGLTPFDGDTPAAVAMQHIHNAPIPPSQFNPSIPHSLEVIILRCLEKVPARRYQDGSQVVHALDIL